MKIALTAEKLCVVGGLLAQRDIFPADLSILATQLTFPAIYFYKVKCNPDKKKLKQSHLTVRKKTFCGLAILLNLQFQFFPPVILHTL